MKLGGERLEAQESVSKCLQVKLSGKLTNGKKTLDGGQERLGHR
jgi:hypothetical protein